MTDSELADAIELERARRAFALELFETRLARLERKLRLLALFFVAVAWTLLVGVASTLSALLIAHALWRLSP
jgi:hypothetical protein